VARGGRAGGGMAEAEPRCVMGGLAGGELRVEVELPGCSAGVPPPPFSPSPRPAPPYLCSLQLGLLGQTPPPDLLAACGLGRAGPG